MSEVSGDGYDSSDAAPNEGATDSGSTVGSGDPEGHLDTGTRAGQEADTGSGPDTGHDLDEVAAPDDDPADSARSDAADRAGASVVGHEAEPRPEPEAKPDNAEPADAEAGVEVNIDHTGEASVKEPNYAAEVRRQADRSADLPDRSTEHRQAFEELPRNSKQTTGKAEGAAEPERTADEKAMLVKDSTRSHYREDSENVDSGRAAGGDATRRADPTEDPADRVDLAKEPDYAAEVRAQAAAAEERLAAFRKQEDAARAGSIDAKLDADGIPEVTSADIASAQQDVEDPVSEAEAEPEEADGRSANREDRPADTRKVGPEVSKDKTGRTRTVDEVNLSEDDDAVADTTTDASTPEGKQPEDEDHDETKEEVDKDKTEIEPPELPKMTLTEAKQAVVDGVGDVRKLVSGWVRNAPGLKRELIEAGVAINKADWNSMIESARALYELPGVNAHDVVTAFGQISRLIAFAAKEGPKIEGAPMISRHLEAALAKCASQKLMKAYPRPSPTKKPAK